MSDRDRKPKFRRGGGKATDRRESGRRPAWRERGASPDDPVILYGWHTAAAFAVKAIVTTARHSPEATGVLAKAASGALELVPLVMVQNLARALTGLNDQGFMTVGLDSHGGENLGAMTLRQPLALVLGAEGKGLRQVAPQTLSAGGRLGLPPANKRLHPSHTPGL